MAVDIQNSVLEEIDRLCSGDDLQSVVVTADDVANALSIKRNTASQYLNLLVKDGDAVKVNTRPVRFYGHKALVRVLGVRPDKGEYASVQELFVQKRASLDPLGQVIGAQQSLFSQIKRMKAAARYPGVGLPILLTGPTGSGKSYLAKMFYNYCVQQGYLSSDSQFVHLNCAEYADNPELLASILFGYKRGAYTGADHDSAGLFDRADKGMLFLDEVHRLGAKGQEKLFEYLDNGVVSPLGETKSSHHVQVRLIFATTENIQSTFLQTFIRRIPVQVEIPGINDRTQFEREALTKLFFLNQAKHVQRTLAVSKQVLGILTGQHYDSNVGQMKNHITLTVASALSKAGSLGDDDKLHINVSDLPAEIWRRSNAESEGTRLKLTGDSSTVDISPAMELSELIDDESDQDNQIRQTFRRIAENYQHFGLNDMFLGTSSNLINALTDEMIFSEVIDRGEVPLNLLKKIMKVKLDSLASDYSVEFSGNGLVIIAYFFYYRQFSYWMLSAPDHALLTKISDELASVSPRIARFTDEITKMIETSLSLPIDVVDRLFLQLYLQDAVKINRDNAIRCIVLAHGYSTASSIANVVNRVIGKQIIGYIDMPLNIDVETIGQRVSDYIASHSITSGMILMVDMGSLAGIHKYIHGTIDFPIGIITNVSTQTALVVADQVMHKKDIATIVNSTAAGIKSDGRVIYPEKVKKNLIITCCNTGIGTANQIKSLLDTSFADKLDVVVNAYDYRRIRQEGQIEVLKKTYNVLAIVGTVDPKVKGIPFVPLEKLIVGEDSELLQDALGSVANSKQIDESIKTILHNFTIERVINSLTILDASAVMDTIDIVMERYVELAKKPLPNSKRMALYVHVSCLIERLIRNEPIMTYDWEHSQCDTKVLENLKTALSVVEDKYSVTIPKSELGYIDDIVEG